MFKTFFTFALNAIPMGGLRTYIMGAIGLLLAAFLMYTGNWELGGTLLVLSLQVIFLRAGTENLTTTIGNGLEAIITRKTAVFSLPEVPLPDPLPEPDLPADKYLGMENNDRKATGQDIF
ncbi:hypothetical protein [Thiothrix lacustris]|uniref:hypothetical protein n=1 Tax=Thiothrix lacustris TaxID=525917 RepID=UPI00049072E9|nr:hypothetical protein [Thiothrix lacustris]